MDVGDGRAARHDRRPAGHRPRLQDADRSGRRDRRRGPDLPRRGADVRRVRGGRRADRDGSPTACASTCSRQTLDRLEREGRTPKFIYTVPTFQNPAGVTMSLERRRRLVQIAEQREILVLEDNPYGLLRYEGEPLPPLYALDGGEYVIYLGTFSKILSAGLRLGWTAAPRPVLEKLNLAQAGRRPLLVAVRAVLRHRVLRAARLARHARRPARALPAAARHAARRARRSTSRPRRSGRGPAAGCSSGRRCPTTSTRPTCWRARCASTSRSSPAAPRSSTAAAARRCG